MDEDIGHILRNWPYDPDDDLIVRIVETNDGIRVHGLLREPSDNPAMLDRFRSAHGTLLPGAGKAAAMGDLDDDGLEDLVITLEGDDKGSFLSLLRKWWEPAPPPAVVTEGDVTVDVMDAGGDGNGGGGPLQGNFFRIGDDEQAGECDPNETDPPCKHTGPAEIVHIVLADLDEDGHLDVVTGKDVTTGRVEVTWGQGGFDYVATSSYSDFVGGLNCPRPVAVAVGDFREADPRDPVSGDTIEEDRHLDLVVGCLVQARPRVDNQLGNDGVVQF